ncbi:MAG: hypothetical protein D6746_10615 [Bacteroidetes bacterium]|nr:MAG: hypothetical protein D6746_10615 [Bacteroidota bacterium]
MPGKPYRMFALPDKGGGSPREVRSMAQARFLNARGYGIFRVPNPFWGRRLRRHCTGIRYWFAEIDHASKRHQLATLLESPLLPTCVVESRRGFHVYWRALDGDLETWDEIVKGRIIPALEADPKASDPLRMLRAPGFYHHKAEPFLVRVVYYSGAAYTVQQVRDAFPLRRRIAGCSEPPRLDGQGFWYDVARLDARKALPQLNGHWLVNGESFELKELHNGHANIYRIEPDGSLYSTGCWIDEHGRLCGVDGGSSIAAWCHWYGHTWRDIRRGLLEVFPEIEATNGSTEVRAGDAASQVAAG